MAVPKKGTRALLARPCRVMLGSEYELLLLGARAASVVAIFARAVVGFVLGLLVCVEVHRLAAVLWWCFPELIVVVLLVAIALPSRLRCIAWLPYVLVWFFRIVGCCPGAHCCDLLVESSSLGLDCCVQSAHLLLVKVEDLDPMCGPVFGQFAVLLASKFLGCASGTTCGSLWFSLILLALLFPLSWEEEACCVPSSSAFRGLLGVVVLSHGIWWHVVHCGDLCGEGPSPCAVLRLS
ncbi:hypothetical protein Taro_033968 [Colocasia esculenta]|uniref:Transmembrane protein n=1 Tax=Colocasia esculenta TaxID=4460 RepID=A0A843W1K3_COLES|nr:hypothetical protein [Colocasia esculenta]